MKLQLAVGAETLLDLFNDDSIDPEKRMRKERLHKHQLLLSSQLEKYWEDKAKEEGLESIYQMWFVQAIHSAESIKQCDDFEDSDKSNELDILANLASSEPLQIVIHDTTASERSSYSGIRFCDIATFGEQRIAPVDMDKLQEIFVKGKKVKYLFSLFETPVELFVGPNKSAKSLAEYLSHFYDSKEIQIIDRYFVANEQNFKDYVYPYIDKKCKITINFQKQDGASNKKRIEQTYGATVQCYDAEQLHQSVIITSNYRIRLGYRLKQFGVNGKTMRETVDIRKK